MRDLVEKATKDAREWLQSELREWRRACSLEAEHPGAAGSLRAGLDETLPLRRRGIEGTLYRALRSTNTIENLDGAIATYTRDVRRWQGGSMILQWVSAAVLEAQRRSRRIRGYQAMGRLIAASEQIEQKQNIGTDQKVA